jgi:hypothetical protein
LGANLEHLIDIEDGKGTKEADEGEEKTSSAEGGKVVMSIQDMLELRRNMMEKLGTAQNALYFSHALVSLLINSAKADHASTSNPSLARAGSPMSNSAGGAAAIAARGDTAASTSAMQRNTNASHVMGSAANLEAELGIEANVFGSSRLEAERKDVEPREIDAMAEEHEDDDEDDELENLEADLKRQTREDRKLSDIEREEKGRNLVDCYQAKRKGISKAAEILRGGAKALRGSQERNAQEKMRWQVLLGAKRTGWGLTPDKPVRGTASNKRELLEDANRRKDEPARDAWIGYAIPEAQLQYQRRALAYFAHDIVGSADSPGQTLAFASRPKKHLRVRFTYGDEVWTSDGVAEEIKSDPASIDGQLRQAQSELADVEVFEAVLSECRAITTSTLFATTIDREDSIAISMNGVELCLELVENSEQDQIVVKNNHPSAVATAALALLRLGLMRLYRMRDNVKSLIEADPRESKGSQGLHTPLLLPLLGPLHYATFILRLQGILEDVKRKDKRKDYELHGLEKLSNVKQWMTLLLQGSHESNSAEAMNSLGGSATIYIDGEPVAFLGISYPSNMSLSLPMKRNSLGGRGMNISRFDIRALESILSEELQ